MKIDRFDGPFGDSVSDRIGLADDLEKGPTVTRNFELSAGVDSGQNSVGERSLSGIFIHGGEAAVNGECNETGKVRYATARAAHEAIQQAYWGRRTKVQPKRVFFCKRCHGYHLSSKGDLWGRRQRLTERKLRIQQDPAGSRTRRM